MFQASGWVTLLLVGTQLPQPVMDCCFVGVVHSSVFDTDFSPLLHSSSFLCSKTSCQLCISWSTRDTGNEPTPSQTSVPYSLLHFPQSTKNTITEDHAISLNNFKGIQNLNVHLSQLGPNPSSLNHEELRRGNSGILGEDGTLFLVNQSHPFTLHFTANSNGSTSGQKSRESGKGREAQKATEAPKRSIQDFFHPSPKKVWKEGKIVLYSAWHFYRVLLWMDEHDNVGHTTLNVLSIEVLSDDFGPTKVFSSLEAD